MSVALTSSHSNRALLRLCPPSSSEGWFGYTWVGVLLELHGPAEPLRTECKVEILEHHRVVATRMQTHLQLTFENIARFSWTLGTMLDPDPAQAQASAREARRAIVTKSSTSRLMRFVAEDEQLMTQLCAFCERTPPLCLWHGKLSFKDLFVFIACRFLSNPDHVLDAEAVHAKWQWIALAKRNVKLKTMNSILKLSSFISEHGDLPLWDEMEPYVYQVRQYLREQFDLARTHDAVAAGARADWIHRDRFNIGLVDADLLRGVQRATGGSVSTSPQVFCTSYLTHRLLILADPNVNLMPTFTNLMLLSTFKCIHTISLARRLLGHGN